MTIFYILWNSIDANLAYTKVKKESVEEMDKILENDKNKCDLLDEKLRDANQFIVDCGKSTTGLFFGIFTLLLTIMSLITYFIYKEHSQKNAIILSETTELCLLVLSIFVVTWCYFQLRYYKFNHLV